MFYIHWGILLNMRVKLLGDIYWGLVFGRPDLQPGKLEAYNREDC